MANKNITITVTSWGTTITGPTNITITSNVGTATPNFATLSSLTGGTIVTVDETANSVSLTPVGLCSGTTQTFSISSNPSASGVVSNYYRMGNCNEVQYSYTATTNTGFGIIVAPGCATADQLEDLIWSDPAHTTYLVDYNNPCPLPSFTGTTYVARYTGGTVGATAVYNVNGVGCLSIISGETGPSYTVDLNNILTTYVGAGIGACGISPCVGSTASSNAYDVYDAQVCGSSERVLVAELNSFDPFSQITLSGVIGVNVFDVTGYPLTGYCVTILSSYIEPVNFYSATGNTLGNSVGTPVIGVNYISTGTTCGACDTNYYLVRGTKIGGCEEGPFNEVYAWTTSGISVGDVFTMTGITCTDHYCCYTTTYVSPSKLNKYGLYYELYTGGTIFRIYNDCPTCTGDTFQTVTGLTYSYNQPNEQDDGSINVTVSLDSVVDVGSTVYVSVDTTAGTPPYAVEVPILANSASGSTSYSTSQTDVGSINSACITSTTNPMIDPDTFICSP